MVFTSIPEEDGFPASDIETSHPLDMLDRLTKRNKRAVREQGAGERVRQFCRGVQGLRHSGLHDFLCQSFRQWIERDDFPRHDLRLVQTLKDGVFHGFARPNAADSSVENIRFALVDTVFDVFVIKPRRLHLPAFVRQFNGIEGERFIDLPLTDSRKNGGFYAHRL